MFPSPDRSDSDLSRTASPNPGKRRANSPADSQMISLSNSASDLPPYGDNNASMTVVMQTASEWRNRNLPMSHRWAGAISYTGYGTVTETSSTLSAASHAIRQQQRTLDSNSLWIGLETLKQWVTLNVHRILVPPLSAEASRVSARTPSNAFCLAISNDGCGVRSYLNSVCKELRIDFFRVSGTYYEDGMMADLLIEARKSRAALILFDRTSWFTNAEYGMRGASFMHHLGAAIEQRRSELALANLTHGVVSNEFDAAGLSVLLPNLWIVISSSTGDVAPDVLEMARGTSFRLTSVGERVAYNTVRICLQRRADECGFARDATEMVLSQSAYLYEVNKIAATLQGMQVGAIVTIMKRACDNAFARDFASPTHGSVVVNLLPTHDEVCYALNQCNGQAIGAAVAPTSSSSAPDEATVLMSQINPRR